MLQTDVDRKSTRLNSSHRCISYAVFCLKKKKNYDVTYYSSGDVYNPLNATALVQVPNENNGSQLTQACRYKFFSSGFVFFLRIGRPPGSTLFPYTPLFR